MPKLFKSPKFWYRFGLGLGIILLIDALLSLDIPWIGITLIGILKCRYELKEIEKEDFNQKL